MADRLQESESESEAYGVTHMKELLRQHFGDKIVIAEVNGKKNVVTFRQKASSIISEFYSQPRGTDLEAEKLRLIEATVKLIKSDIKSIVQSKDLYPTTLEMNSVQETSAFLPNTLRHFLDCLFVGKNKDVKALKVSSIGQALMQATRPKVLLAPLQLGLGVQMHSHFASRFLVDCTNMDFAVPILKFRITREVLPLKAEQISLVIYQVISYSMLLTTLTTTFAH